MNLAQPAFQAHLIHQTLYGLVVYCEAPVAHLRCHAAVAVAAFVLEKNVFYALSFHCIFVLGLHALQVIVKYGTSHLFQLQQQVERIFKP